MLKNKELVEKISKSKNEPKWMLEIRIKSFKIFEAIAKELYGKTILISVGGVDSAKEAYKRIKAGASLVQILSGLVFRGPNMIMNINKELTELIIADGYKNITQAIGADRK